MRKGAVRKDWTCSEERFLIESAGHMPCALLAQRLGRSRKAIERKAAALRAQGTPVYLRLLTPKMRICPSCGRLSETLGRKGQCAACRNEARYQAAQGRISELLRRLPLEERADYALQDAKCASRTDPLPEAIDVTHIQEPTLRLRAVEYQARRTERVVSANARRRANAAQKRKERIQQKIDASMGVCPSSRENTSTAA